MTSTPADAGRIFRPRLWPTLATLAGLVVLLSLGTWQLQRMAWKRDLIARAGAQLAAPAEPLPAGDLSALDYRRVQASGSYLHALAFAFGLSAENGRPGGRMITPFRLDDGRTILVDRGWMPEDQLPPDPPAGLEPAGTLTLEGIARWRGNAKRGWLAPADAPDGRRWYSWDVGAMAEALGEPFEPLELLLERSVGPTGLPKAEPVSIDFPNDHLGYAITWYGLALVLLVVYIQFSSTKPGIRQT